MSEVEKLYELAGVEPILICANGYTTINCHYSPKDCGFKCNTNKIYPDFTAEKQLGLIKWLAKRFDFGLEYYQGKIWAVQTQLGWDGYEKQHEHKNFDEALSGLINHLWQDLTETEKSEIKELLK